MKVKFILNRVKVTAEFEPGLTLFEYLRQNGCFSVKNGCDHGECGACAVLIDGKAMNSCLILMHLVKGKTVETVEGLYDINAMHPAQTAFLEAGAVQCGYCTPGMIISIEALLRENGKPSEEDIRDAFAGNLCRCTGYVKPVEAVKELVKNEGDER